MVNGELAEDDMGLKWLNVLRHYSPLSIHHKLLFQTKLPALASRCQGGVDRPAVHLALNCVWGRRIITGQLFMGCSLLCPLPRGKARCGTSLRLVLLRATDGSKIAVRGVS
jgi:hypothetical protein